MISFPAIAERDQDFLIETPYGPRHFIRSRATLERIRRKLGEYSLAGQYQQAPAPLGGGMVKREWLRTYHPNELPDRFDQVVQSWDTANKSVGTQRLQRLHELGYKEPPDFSTGRAAKAVGVSRAQARCTRASVSVSSNCDLD